MYVTKHTDGESVTYLRDVVMCVIKHTTGPYPDGESVTG